MALQFTAYPIPERQPNEIATLMNSLMNSAQMYGQYRLQKSQLDQTKENARQQRILDYIKIKGEYGDQVDDSLRNAGVSFPGMMQGPLQKPGTTTATPATAVPPSFIPGAQTASTNASPFMPVPTAPMSMASNPNTPMSMMSMGQPASAATAPTDAPAAAAPTMPTLKSPLDITPDYLANLRKTKGTKGSEQFIKEQEFLTGQRKAGIEVDQNTPATADQVRAALSPFGPAGADAAERLVASSPNGVPRTLLGNTQTALSNMNSFRARTTDIEKAPTGYRKTPDGRLEAIPGGPADQKIKDKATKEQGMVDAQIAQANTVISKVDQALAKVSRWTTGAGARLGDVPGTSARDLRSDIDTIKGILGFATLQDMRRNSPTGGALGQVSDNELRLLTSTVASLDQAQSADQLRRSLGEIKTHYQKWLETVRQANSTGTQGAPESNLASASNGGDPLGIR